MEDALPGRPSPLGATPRDGGINFAVASTVAESAEVCLFDEAGRENRFRLPDYDGGAWHGIGLKGSGQAYGFRVRGPYDTARGLRCNPAKLLLDPYARAIRGEVSFGVPMLLGGDELGRTQGGNNNAYCQDNEISWVDWSAADTGLLDFVRGLVALRQAHPVLRRHRYLTGVEAGELGWFTPAGTPMNEDCWNDPEALALGVYLDGSDAPDTGPDGQLLLDDNFLVLVNGWWEPLEFTIPECRPGLTWRAEIDTFDPAAVAAAAQCRAGGRVTAGPRSVLVLRGPRIAPTPESP